MNFCIITCEYFETSTFAKLNLAKVNKKKEVFVSAFQSTSPKTAPLILFETNQLSFLRSKNFRTLICEFRNNFRRNGRLLQQAT